MNKVRNLNAKHIFEMTFQGLNVLVLRNEIRESSLQTPFCDACCFSVEKDFDDESTMWVLDDAKFSTRLPPLLCNCKWGKKGKKLQQSKIKTPNKPERKNICTLEKDLG